MKTFNNKEIDRQSYLHRKSEHPETLKRSIPYLQALRLKEYVPQWKISQSNLKCSQSG